MIPLMRHTFSHERETRIALAHFVSGESRLSMGEQCERFEVAFAASQCRRHAVLFNSGGSANLALLQSLLNLERLRIGDCVGFSALTWATNVMPILQLGMVPAPIDCCLHTLNVMSGGLLDALDNMRPSALFVTNALGLTGDLPELQRTCEALDILLLEDNCEALGTRLPEGMAGGFGLAATYSFFVGHHLSTIEGGMVCTDDDELDGMLRMVRANGWDRNLSEPKRSQLRARYEVSDFDAKYTFYDLGYNLRPTEVTGFLGNRQLQYLADNIDGRDRLFRLFNGVTRTNDDLSYLNTAHIDEVSAFAFPVVCRDAQTRDVYVGRFASAGVETRPMIAGNIQRQPFFRKYIGSSLELAGAEKLHECGLYCGLYPDMTDQDIETITSCLFQR